MIKCIYQNWSYNVYGIKALLKKKGGEYNKKDQHAVNFVFPLHIPI